MDWLDKFKTGVVELDREHRYFHDLIAPLNEEALRSWSVDRFRVLLADIHRFTYFHFRTEERLMDEYGYLDTTAHAAEHAKMTNTIESFVRQADAGVLDVMALRTFLQEWLLVHTTVSDKPLALHVSRVREELTQV